MSITCVGGRLGGTGLGAIAILLLHAGGQPLLAQQPNTAATPAVTFARDVAPIFQKNCQECHRPGAVGPMSGSRWRSATAFSSRAGRLRDDDGERAEQLRALAALARREGDAAAGEQ